MSGYRYPGKPGKQMDAEHRARVDLSPLVTRCGFCRWTHVGTALEGRDAYHAHRTTSHPEVKPRRVRRSTLGRWISRDSDKSFKAEGDAAAAEVAAMHAKREAAA